MKWNRRMAVKAGSDWRLRVWESRGTRRRSPSILIKCGCCAESVRAYFDENGLEINGVNADWDEWLALLHALRPRMKCVLRKLRENLRG